MRKSFVLGVVTVGLVAVVVSSCGGPRGEVANIRRQVGIAPVTNQELDSVPPCQQLLFLDTLYQGESPNALKRYLAEGQTVNGLALYIQSRLFYKTVVLSSSDSVKRTGSLPTMFAHRMRGDVYDSISMSWRSIFGCEN